jgi:hypothetical protein
MNSKTKNMAAMYALMAYSATTGGNQIYDIENEKSKSIKSKPPKGAKEYFFTKDGDCFTVKYEDTKFVFSCYAINKKNAFRKFKRWHSGINKYDSK